VSRSAEGRGATVEEATQDALRALGVGPNEVDVQVLAEGRRGLFGAGKRAHVRATVREERQQEAPQQEEEAVEDTDATPVDEAPEVEESPEVEDREAPAGEEEEAELTPEERMDMLDEEADLAADFVEGLLDRLDLPGDIEIEVHEEQAIVNIQEVGSGLLIGRRGATLEALQELVRGAVQRQTERRSHVRVDVEGYRARQLEKLRDKCREAIAEVRETGEPVRLEPMDAYERKMMHDLVAKTGGVTSSSEGAEPKRRVVVHPE
jgi:spoIIIJ-associated protein